MSGNKKKPRHEAQNLRRFRAIVEEFAGVDEDLHGVEGGKVKKEHVQSRKSRRKEERKLKKMRKHAFKQHKPVRYHTESY